MKRLRVVVLFGGRSVEREVSRISARTIVGALDPSRYEVVPLAVGQDGRFLSPAVSGGLLSSGRMPEKFLAGEKDAAPPGEAIVPAEIGPSRADVVIPIIHGTTGEDGTLQGFLKLAQIPFVGCGVLGSAICMDKEVARTLMATAGIPVVETVVANDEEWQSNPNALLDRVEKKLGYPYFVKPANAGSSVGVHKVKNRNEAKEFIGDSFLFDLKVLFEQSVDAREIECSVLGNAKPRASILGEIVPKHEFYSYEAKYMEKMAPNFASPQRI